MASLRSIKLPRDSGYYVVVEHAIQRQLLISACSDHRHRALAVPAFIITCRRPRPLWVFDSACHALPRPADCVFRTGGTHISITSSRGGLSSPLPGQHLYRGCECVHSTLPSFQESRGSTSQQTRPQPPHAASRREHGLIEASPPPGYYVHGVWVITARSGPRQEAKAGWPDPECQCQRQWSLS